MIELLGDTDFELRFRAASNLLKIHRVNATLRIPSDFLFGIVEREAAECRRRWRNQIALDPRLTGASARRDAPSTSGR